MKLNRHLSMFTEHARMLPRRLLFTGAFLVIITVLAAGAFAWLNAPKLAHAASWNLVWSDDFTGAAGSGLNTSNWKYDTGQGVWGTGEIENMTTSTANVFQDGTGHLVVKAIRDGNGNWTSGRFESVQGFTPPAGGMMAFESSIALPNVTGAAAQGYWPAFWSLGNTFRTGTAWPTSGEIDTMESINGTNVDYAHFHCGVPSGGPCNEPSGLGGSTSPTSGSILQGNFHTYRMELDYSSSPQQIRFYLDGNHFTTVNANQVDATTWAKATASGFFMMYDLAIGGSWPGNPTSSTVSGASMVVDYARVYYSGGTTPTPTNTPRAGTPTPTPRAGTPTPTPPPTSTPSSGGNGVTASGVVASNSPWFGEEDVKFSNTSPITAMTITITVQKTKGISYSGTYSTFGGATTMHTDNGSTITYTFTLGSGQTISPSSNLLAAAQFSGTGSTHATSGDKWSISSTSGGATNTLSGHF